MPTARRELDARTISLKITIMMFSPLQSASILFLFATCVLFSGCAGRDTASAPGSPAATAPDAPSTPAMLPPPAPGHHRLTIRATVPEGTGTVYMPGSHPQLGPWNPRAFALSGTGPQRTATLDLPAGAKLEFKFTLGSWETEALGPDGAVPPNHVLVADADKEIVVEIKAFKKLNRDYFRDWQGSGVIGRLEYMQDMPSKFLTPVRNVVVWLPPEYDADPNRRFPVLYMHDGQNLFDPRLANTGTDWGVDECIVRLVNAGKIEPVLVVGVWCTDDRRREYSPWEFGPRYAEFLIKELMPVINANYRTRTGPQNTAAMGSSMGGLISFHLGRTHPDVFGKVGCVSTHWPYGGAYDANPPLPPRILRDIADPAFRFPKGVRAYFDYGTVGLDANYEPLQDQVTAWLEAQGLVAGRDFLVHKAIGATHNEAAWRERLDIPMQFLFGPAR